MRLLAVGDNTVDRYPAWNLCYPGGNAVNVAVHARRLGSAVSYIGAVGTDRAGAVVLGALRDEGVDAARVRVVDGPNSHSVVRHVGGDRIFAGGNLGVSVFDLDPEDVAFASLADVVHTGACSHLERQLPELADAAKLLSFDFSERDWSYIESLAPYVDMATRSTPGTDRRAAIDDARRLQELGPRTVAVTLGAGGAVLLHDDVLGWSPTPRGATVVDTLGAGDALIARLLVGLTRGEATAGLVAEAVGYATANCLGLGAFGHAAVLDPTAATTQRPPIRQTPVRRGSRSEK